MHAKSRAPLLSTLVALHPHGSIAVLGRRPATGAVARPRGWCDDDDSGGHRERESPVVMYTAPHPASTSINGMGSDMIDGSGTINPAALNTPGNYSSPSSSLDHMGVVIPPSSTTAAKSSPRGLKRSRSPDDSDDSPFGEADDGR